MPPGLALASAARREAREKAAMGRTGKRAPIYPSDPASIAADARSDRGRASRRQVNGIRAVPQSLPRQATAHALHVTSATASATHAKWHGGVLPRVCASQSVSCSVRISRHCLLEPGGTPRTRRYQTTIVVWIGFQNDPWWKNGKGPGETFDLVRWSVDLVDLVHGVPGQARSFPRPKNRF